MKVCRNVIKKFSERFSEISRDGWSRFFHFILEVTLARTNPSTRTDGYVIRYTSRLPSFMLRCGPTSRSYFRNTWRGGVENRTKRRKIIIIIIMKIKAIRWVIFLSRSIIRTHLNVVSFVQFPSPSHPTSRTERCFVDDVKRYRVESSIFAFGVFLPVFFFIFIIIVIISKSCASLRDGLSRNIMALSACTK